MSIRHEVSIHCDTCGDWEWGSDGTTRSRRRRGWKIWQDDYGHWCHKCPQCSSAATQDGAE